MHTHKTAQFQLGQQGIVSIMVAMVLMAVMTLIVLGFAEISRRDQRETLDRQLSTQAFYAAETGVNDAQKIIESALSTPGYNLALLDKQTCSSAAPYTSNSIANGVQYTCLLVNTTPPTLLYTLSPGDSAKVVPLESANGATHIKSIKLQWGPSVSASSTPRTNCPSAGTYRQLPPASAGGWRCGFGVLRVDLVPVGARNVDTSTRNNLLANTFTAFFVPTTSGVTPNVAFNGSNLYGGVANQGSIVGAGCQLGSTGPCAVTINIANTNSTTYYMRVSTIYTDASLTISAYAGANGNGAQLNLKNAQALVDVTGQAQDVLRRIQVRIPMSNNGALDSDYGIESTNPICKEFTTYPGVAQDASGLAVCALP